MNEKNSLIIKKNNLPQAIQNGAKKIIKIAGFGALTVGSASLGLIGIPTMPVIAIPAVIGTVYGAHKFANEAIYKSHKDVAFIISKSIKGNYVISQDAFRLDITSKTKGMSLREIAAFIQLQAIVGISKLDKLNKKGEIINYKIESHGAIRTTLKKLKQMGIITDYAEEYKRKSKLIIEKLAMGNRASLKNKEDMYNIKFKIGEKRLDFDDPEFRKNFKLIFSEKSGLLAKRNWDVILQEDGTYGINYNAEEPFMSRIKRNSSRNATLLKSFLKEESPSPAEQRRIAGGFSRNDNVTGNVEMMDENVKCEKVGKNSR